MDLTYNQVIQMKNEELMENISVLKKNGNLTRLGREKPTPEDSLFVICCVQAANNGSKEAANYLRENPNEDFSITTPFYTMTKEYAYSAWRLGYIKEFKCGYQRNYDEAIAHYTVASEKGLFSGSVGLAEIFRHRRDGNKNLPESIKWYMKAIQQGYNRGVEMIASIYQNEKWEGKSALQQYKELSLLYQKEYIDLPMLMSFGAVTDLHLELIMHLTGEKARTDIKKSSMLVKRDSINLESSSLPSSPVAPAAPVASKGWLWGWF
jgi:hypothetical protein